MTDRHAGYVVTLAADVREDQVEAIVTALGMITGVASVTPVVSDPIPQSIGAMRRDVAWTEELLAIVDRMRDSQ